jgi:hypothetical protein
VGKRRVGRLGTKEHVVVVSGLRVTKPSLIVLLRFLAFFSLVSLGVLLPRADGGWDEFSCWL